MILGRAASHFGIEIEPEAAGELAEVSRGTPRRGIALLRQLRNEAVVGQRPVIDVAHVARTLDRLGIDGQGLGPLDRRSALTVRGSARWTGAAWTSCGPATVRWGLASSRGSWALTPGRSSASTSRT
ncbi:MAG: hypothetical protein ACYS0J_14285 [Planctomycetota bacterium]